VTGASSGIGRGLAWRLARDGFHVHLGARRLDRLHEVSAEIASAGGQSSVLAIDVSHADATVEAIRALDARVGGLDLIVANAGVGVGSRELPTYAWESVREAFHTNVCGATATLTAVLPAMVRRGRGHLVGISSLASFGALPGSAAYCAPKAALSMLLKCLRLDTLDTGVAVTAVHVGFVDTAMLEHATHPTPQRLTVTEAADAIVRELDARPATIELPRALAIATRVAANLPRPVRDAMARRWAAKRG